MPRKNLLSLHEAIVVALINKPGRSARLWEIAQYIEDRNLYPVRKGGISLEKQIMLRATKSKGAYHHLFEDMGFDYIRLRDQDIDFPLRFWNGLEALLEYDKKYFNPALKKLSVVRKNSQSKETIKLELSPANIVCIVSEEKSRRKNIYVLEKNSAGKDVINCYLFNSNEYNFESLAEYLDRTNKYLLVVSRNAIANVAFYELNEKHLLHFNRPGLKLNPPSPIKMSAKKEDDLRVKAFKIIQEVYKGKILLQKAAIGYKNDMGF